VERLITDRDLLIVSRAEVVVPALTIRERDVEVLIGISNSVKSAWKLRLPTIVPGG
jgi:hypothetical protein